MAGHLGHLPVGPVVDCSRSSPLDRTAGSLVQPTLQLETCKLKSLSFNLKLPQSDSEPTWAWSHNLQHSRRLVAHAALVMSRLQMVEKEGAGRSFLLQLWISPRLESSVTPLAGNIWTRLCRVARSDRTLHPVVYYTSRHFRAN